MSPLPLPNNWSRPSPPSHLHIHVVVVAATRDDQIAVRERSLHWICPLRIRCDAAEQSVGLVVRPCSVVECVGIASRPPVSKGQAPQSIDGEWPPRRLA